MVTASIINLKNVETHQIKSLNDLRGKTVGVFGEEHLVYFVKQYGAHAVYNDDEKALLNDVIHGKLDAVIESKAVAEQYLKEHSELPLHIAPKALKKENFAFMFHKGDKKHIDRFNEGLLRLQYEGQTVSICLRYVSQHGKDCEL